MKINKKQVKLLFLWDIDWGNPTKIKIMDWKIPPESRKQGAIPIPDTSAEGTSGWYWNCTLLEWWGQNFPIHDLNFRWIHITIN